jgi:hypothetical protein
MAGAAAISAPLLGAAGSGGVSDIPRFIGPIDAAHAGKGLAYDLGAVLPLTGPGAFYGRVAPISTSSTRTVRAATRRRACK